MTHLDYDMIYRLAQAEENCVPFDDEETDAMEHLVECKDCFDEFISVKAILVATSESGFALVEDMFDTFEETSSEPNKMMAVISVVVEKVKDKLDIAMKQIKEFKDGLVFEEPFAMSARGVGAAQVSSKKIEDIENERTFVNVDTKSDELTIQVDVDGLDVGYVRAYIKTESGDIREVTLSKSDTVFVGKISNIPKERFNVYIEKMNNY